MNTYLALDLGGTKLMIAEVSEKGEILRSKQYMSGYRDQQEGVTKILESLDDYMTTVGFIQEPTAVGMGMTGKVDHRKGIWRSLGHLDQELIPLAELLTKKTGLPAVIDNDMHSAATAELMLGCGTYCDDFIYLNVGTGLAAGFVADRHVIHGVNNMSGEVGHTSIGINHHIKCICDKEGCCENTVSGIGFDGRARSLIKEYPDCPLQIPADPQEKVSGKDIFELAAKGDAMCSRIVDEAVETLVILITNMVRYTDPAVIVMGGGMAMNDELFTRVKAGLTKYSVMGNVPYGVIRSSFSPDKVGIIGAAALAIERYGRKSVS